jgi:GntR family transcriptional repressor for pyruvate dehydrogenase complex
MAAVSNKMSMAPISLRTGPEILANQLREKILSGTFGEGTALAPERLLVEQTGLSRPTVREALRILEAEGLVETRQGRNGGAWIRRPDETFVSKALNLFIRGLPVALSDLVETRKILETGIARVAALRRTDDDLRVIAAIAKRVAKVAHTDPLQAIKENIAWHLAVAKASHNDLLIAVMAAFSNAVDPTAGDREMAQKLMPTGAAGLVKAQQRIFEAIAARDADAAARRMLRHFEAFEAMVKQTEARGRSPSNSKSVRKKNVSTGRK